ncbi:MAG: hydrogenase nickel incorporation protein HypB [Cyclobacteriaceae bacterium]|nr:hydrogenase nickel incorporation protein HypB [Cyclobacteriaceae bacterium]
MCSTCGCDQPGGITITRAGLDTVNFSPVSPSSLIQPQHHHPHTDYTRVIELEQNILEKNDRQALHNREHFQQQQVLALNLVSSPGSGKTALLERTLTDLKGKHAFCVIEGDQQTMNDANRIAATGVEAVQINTGKGCHLDADMVHRALHQLNLTPQSILFIENVGNLVCPALFDLGEEARVAIISVTEGDDKPLKYPDMFASSQLCIINKIDLLPYVNFKVERAKEYARKVNPTIEFLELSTTLGLGMTSWYQWLEKKLAAKARQLAENA